MERGSVTIVICQVPIRLAAVVAPTIIGTFTFAWAWSITPALRWFPLLLIGTAALGAVLTSHQLTMWWTATFDDDRPDVLQLSTWTGRRADLRLDGFTDVEVLDVLTRIDGWTHPTVVLTGSRPPLVIQPPVWGADRGTMQRLAESLARGIDGELRTGASRSFLWHKSYDEEAPRRVVNLKRPGLESRPNPFVETDWPQLAGILTATAIASGLIVAWAGTIGGPDYKREFSTVAREREALAAGPPGVVASTPPADLVDNVTLGESPCLRETAWWWGSTVDAASLTGRLTLTLNDADLATAERRAATYGTPLRLEALLMDVDDRTRHIVDESDRLLATIDFDGDWVTVTTNLRCVPIDEVGSLREPLRERVAAYADWLVR